VIVASRLKVTKSRVTDKTVNLGWKRERERERARKKQLLL